MDESLTREQLDNMREVLKVHAFKPRIVKSQVDADFLSMIDPTEYKWKVGDEYYLLESIHGQRPVKYGVNQ